jgi:catecholate siderophore receptor
MAFIQAKKHPMTKTALASALLLAIPTMSMAAQNNATAEKAGKLAEVEIKASSIEPEFIAKKVSSAKHTQPLVNTPQTIVVVKKELFQQQAATSLAETLRNTPGITMLMGENGNTATGDSIFMRGFDTQGSIFVDGIRDLGSISRDTFNTEQVEIAKGPAGVDNGRGAASGYVNLSSKSATMEDATTIGATFGSGKHKRTTFDSNQTLAIENAALRVNLLWQDSGIPGRDQAENNRLGIATSLGLGLDTATRAYLNVFHVKQSSLQDGGVPTVGLPGYYNAIFDPAKSATFTKGGPLAGVVPAKADPTNFYGDADDLNDVTAQMFTVKVEHDLNTEWTIRNTSRFGESTQDMTLTAPFWGIFSTGSEAKNDLVVIKDPAKWNIEVIRQGVDRENRILTNQTNLTGHLQTGAVKHDLTSGVEFIYESQLNNNVALASNITARPQVNLYQPDTRVLFPKLGKNGQLTDGETMTSALYLHNTAHINEQWQLSTGLRAEHYNTDTHRVVAQGAVAKGQVQTIPVGTLLPQSASASDNLLSYKVGALYKPAENGSVYVSYATSQLPPGSSNFALTTTSGVNGNSPNVDPQKGTNLELGTKWNLLDNSMALTAAVFESVNDNEFVTDTDGTVRAIGEKQVRGLELGVVGKILPQWELSFGASLLDPKITSGNKSGSRIDDGGTIAWSPKQTVTLWNSYQLNDHLTIAGGMRYVSTAVSSSVVLETAKATRSVLEIPSYSVFDMMASYAVNPSITVQLNINNLTDKIYISALNNAGFRYFPGEERSAKLGVNVAF